VRVRRQTCTACGSCHQQWAGASSTTIAAARPAQRPCCLPELPVPAVQYFLWLIFQNRLPSTVPPAATPIPAAGSQTPSTLRRQGLALQHQRRHGLRRRVGVVRRRKLLGGGPGRLRGASSACSAYTRAFANSQYPGGYFGIFCAFAGLLQEMIIGYSRITNPGYWKGP
jgi:hypothetical protein